MLYVYVAMVLHRAEKEVNEKNMEAVLKAAGVTVDSARIKATVAALRDVDIADVIKNAAVVAPSAPASAEAKPEGGEAKTEEKPEDKGKSEEEAAAGLGALFG